MSYFGQMESAGCEQLGMFSPLCCHSLKRTSTLRCIFFLPSTRPAKYKSSCNLVRVTVAAMKRGRSYLSEITISILWNKYQKVGLLSNMVDQLLIWGKPLSCFHDVHSSSSSDDSIFSTGLSIFWVLLLNLLFWLARDGTLPCFCVSLVLLASCVPPSENCLQVFGPLTVGLLLLEINSLQTFPPILQYPFSHFFCWTTRLLRWILSHLCVWCHSLPRPMSKTLRPMLSSKVIVHTMCSGF